MARRRNQRSERRGTTVTMLPMHFGRTWTQGEASQFAARGSIALAVALTTTWGCEPSYRYHEVDGEMWEYEDLLGLCSSPGTPASSPALTPAGETWGVDHTCAEAIGQVFGIDWVSFDEQPDTFTDASTPAELVIAGFVAVLGANGMSVKTTRSEGIPGGLDGELERLAERWEIPMSGDAGEVWFRVLATHIDKVRYDPLIDAAMSYRSSVVTIGDVADEYESGITPRTPSPPVEVASSLVHEAAHGFLTSHVDCENGEENACDDDAEGAFGAQTWWLYEWLLINAPDLEWLTCTDGTGVLSLSCARIIDNDDYEPCHGFDSIGCEYD